MRSPRLGAVVASLLCLLPVACATPTTGVGTAPGTTSAVPSPTPSAAADPVERALAGLDRREQVAQLIVVGVALTDLSPADGFAAEGVGGVFLQGRSRIPADELATETARWAEAAPGPRPWIGVDQEGGAVQTLSGPGFADLPPADRQGRLPAEELAALADDMGASLSSAGINLNLAPVADVVPEGTEDANAPIGAYGRQYDSTAECKKACASWDLGQFSQATLSEDTVANTIACRRYHAYAALSAPNNDAIHCPHAGPSGDGHCGTICDNYCQLVRKGCEEEFATRFGADEPLVTCQAECAQLLGTDNPADQADEGYAAESAPTSGDSIQCRIYHAVQAFTDPTTCPAALGEAGSVCTD